MRENGGDDMRSFVHMVKHENPFNATLWVCVVNGAATGIGTSVNDVEIWTDGF